MTDRNEQDNRIELVAKPQAARPVLHLGLPAFLSMFIALSVLIASTYAWYVTNRQTLKTDAEVYSGGVDAAILPYSLFINVRSELINQQTGDYDYAVQVFNDTDQAALNTYDAILGRNPYTSAYIRMPAYGVQEGSGLTFTITAAGTLNDTNGNSSGVNAYGRNLLMNQFISNIIRISCANIPASVISPSADKEDVYAGAKNWFDNNLADSATFVQYSPGATSKDPVVLNSKNSTVSFSFTSNDYTIESDGMVYVYFKIDYDYPLVDAYINALRIQMGGFKIGQEGHADFTGAINPGFDLVSIQMAIL